MSVGDELGGENMRERWRAQSPALSSGAEALNDRFPIDRS